MDNQQTGDVWENHQHVWWRVRKIGNRCFDVRCMTCNLEAVEVLGKIYKTFKQYGLAFADK